MDSERREHAARPRETRRDSDSSESSQPERTSRASPRKRAPQSHADPDPANATHARTQAPRVDDRTTDVDPDALDLYRARPPPPAETERRFPLERVLVSVPREPAHRRVDPRRSATPRTCDRTRGSPLSTRTLARPQNISIGTLRTARHCLKPHRALDSSSRPASKFARFSQTPSYSSRCATAREVAGRISSLSWLGSEEAEKVRRSHVADSVADYEKFREGLTTIFGRFEFEGAFRAQLRSLKQSGAESVTAYAARTTDLCSRAYAEFATEAQLSLAVDHFIGGLADTSTREYLLRERARRPLEWMEVVRIAQASETARLSNAPLGAAAACDSSAIVGPDSSVCAPLSDLRDSSHANISQSRAQPDHAPAHARSFGNRRDHPSKPNVREQRAHANASTGPREPIASRREARPIRRREVERVGVF